MESLTTTVPGHTSAGPAATQGAVVLHDLDHLAEALGERLASGTSLGDYVLMTLAAARDAASSLAHMVRADELTAEDADRAMLTLRKAINSVEREHTPAATREPSAATSPLEEWVLRILTAHPLSTADVIASLDAIGEGDAEAEVREALQRLAASGRIAERTITAWTVTP